MNLLNIPKIVSAFLFLVGSFAHSQQQPRLNHRWEVEPDLGVSWEYVPALPQQTLDPRRISSTEAQIRITESQKAVRYSDGETLAGRAVGLQSILEQLKLPEGNRLLQLSLVSAAIKLADASRAAELWERIQSDDASRRLVEPALVKWRSPVALALWRERMRDAKAPQLELMTAIEGVGAMGNEQDRTVLEALLRNDRMSVWRSFN